MKIVNKMGYSMGMLEKAVQKLELTSDEMNVANLLDIVFEIENEDTSEMDATGEDTKTTDISLLENVKEVNDSPNKEIREQMLLKHGNDSTKEINQKESLDQLSEENTRLKGKLLCKICLDDEVSVIFLPCRHMVCCNECGAAVKHCPVCRTLIVGTVKPFFNNHSNN